MQIFRKHLKLSLSLLLIAGIAFLHVLTVQAANIYWYSTSSTDWSNASNWYNDSGHTSSANRVPTSSDAAILVGGVAPILDLDVSVVPSSISSSGLTGGANTSGVIVTSQKGRLSSVSITGNATFNNYSRTVGEVSGNGIFNNYAQNGGPVGGDAIFNNFSFNNGVTISGHSTFHDYSYNTGLAAFSADFYDDSGNSGGVTGAAIFHDHSYDYFGYGSDCGTATFNDYSYDFQSSGDFSCGGATFNNVAPSFVFNGASSSDWNDSSNWANNTVPGTNDDAYIYAQVVTDATAPHVNNAYFRGGSATCDTSGGPDFVVDGKAVFSESAFVGSCVVTGQAVFETQSYNSNLIQGNALFLVGAYNNSQVNGDATFMHSSPNYGSIGNGYFIDTGDNQGSLSGNGLFYSSTQEGFVQGDVTFIGNTVNYGEVVGNTLFFGDSQNNGSLDANASFYDSTANSSQVSGTATFFGDSSSNNSTNVGALVRHYTSNVSTAQNFVAGLVPWTVVADNATVDVSGASFNVHTVFQTIGTGSFIGNTGFGGISVASPIAGSTVTSWNPSVSWHANFNVLTSCQYSFGNIAHWNGTDDWNNGSPESGTWHGVSCAGNGSDILAPTTTGAITLAVRGFESGNVFSTSTLISFTNSPGQVTYFYNSGSDPSWSTVGNWYSNSIHTVGAGRVPRAIDTVTVLGSTSPQASIDSWTQPISIYAQPGVILTSASSASTSLTITGNATFNGSARNSGTVNGNATFNGTSANSSIGRVNSNATFNTSSSNVGTILRNATFYNDGPLNTGTISGIKTRYYNATTTTTKNFSNGWTVIADSVEVTVSGATYNSTTRFKTVNNGLFIGGPTTVYWWSNNVNNAWTNAAHWYTDDATTTTLGRLPLSTETVVTLGTVAPTVDLDNIAWVTPTGIDATKTGILFTSVSSATLATAITGTTTFAGSAINASIISGDVTFSGTAQNNSSGVISGTVVFGTSSYNNGGVISGNATFNNSSYNTNSGTLNGNATFNSSSYNGTTSGAISGTATFNSSSRNDGILANNGIFVGDLSANNGTTTGTRTRYYTANATTSRNFVSTGPWILVADAAIVNLSAISSFSASTTFQTLNSGSFTGEGLPGSTNCSKPLYFAGTYTLSANSTSTCDIRVSGVTVNGGSHTLGHVPVALPDNAGTANGIDMTSNKVLFHMENIVGQGDAVTGGLLSMTGSVTSTTTGKLGSAANFPGSTSYLKFPDSNLPEGTTTRSVSFWFNVPDVNGFKGIFGIGDSGPNNAFYGLLIGNQLCIGHWGNAQGCAGSIVSNTWNHGVITYDGATTRLYLNGSLVVTDNTLNFNTTSRGYLIIGKDFPEYDQFVGKLDEFSIWNRVLSLSEVSALYNSGSGLASVGNESGLVALFHLNGSSYSITMADSSGQSNNATLSGLVSTTTSAVTGAALQFDGATTDVSVPSYTNSNGVQTTALWVKVNSNWQTLGTNFSLINMGSSQQFNISLGTCAGQNLCPRIYAGAGGSGGTINSGSIISDGHWHQIIVVANSNTGSVYVDGILSSTNSLTASAASGLHIGTLQGNSLYSPVLMDEVSVWNRALSGVEVVNLSAQQGGGLSVSGNGYSFGLSNITILQSIGSIGATINITNTTTNAVDVSSSDVPGNAMAGGTLILVNSHTGAITANGGNSTDYGYGGVAGVVTKDGSSSYTSKTNNAGSNGPNLGNGQQSGNSAPVYGCTDPNASNYSSSANIYDGSCHYSSSGITISGCTDPSATNYNPSASVNNGSCSYLTYSHYTPPSSNQNSGHGPNPSDPFSAQQSVGGALGSGGIFQVLPPVAQVGNINLAPLPIFGDTTSKRGFSFISSLESYLFKPIVLDGADLLKKYLAEAGIAYEQNLTLLRKKPLQIPNGLDIPGLFKVTTTILPVKTTTGFKTQEGRVSSYFSSDTVNPLTQLVTTLGNSIVTVIFTPTTKGTANASFGGVKVPVVLSGKALTAIFSVPNVPGTYIFKTSGSPLPLTIVVPRPKIVEDSKSLPIIPTIFQWLRNIF